MKRILFALSLTAALATTLAACGPKTVHTAVAVDTAIVNALHQVKIDEASAYQSGLYAQAKHDAYLKVILQSDQDALALTDAIDQWRLAGGDPKTVPAIVARTKTALQAVLSDLSSAPADNPFVKALKALIGLLS